MPGPLTLAQIATQLGGRIAGDAGVLITQVGSLERAARGQIAFLSNARYRDRLAAPAPLRVTSAPRPETPTRRPASSYTNPYASSPQLSHLSNRPPSQPEA